MIILPYLQRHYLTKLAVGAGIGLSVIFGAEPPDAAATETASLESALARIEQLEQQVARWQAAASPSAQTAPVSLATPNEPIVATDRAFVQPTPDWSPVVPLPGVDCGPCAEVIPCAAPMNDYLVHAGWFSTADLLYLKLHQRGLDFAVSEDGTSFTLGDGQVHSLDYDRDVGYRRSLGYRTKTDWAIRLVHTNYETDGVAYATRPEGIGQLFTTRSQPGGAEEAETARMFSAFTYQLFQLQLERPVYQNRFSLVELFGGIQWLDARQKFRYDYDGRDFTNGLIQDVTNVQGFGLRFGSQGRWRMAGGFSLFGGLATGITLGEFESRFYESNLSDTIVIASVRDEYEQAVASLEANLGVCYCVTDYLSVSVGYEMQQWFDLSDRAFYTDDIQESTYAPLTQDVLLEGLFVQADLVW